ncbi:hypothetical protein B296_00053796 [Ensete ventricosum]|uniref:Uncharacterized protein n=1 Tax=Ensete ventricosum TaxID=4639 RepID=A0A426WX91_ENSVE|nr:hypothetical protein B296_00053796 [Ensete ventricosum]
MIALYADGSLTTINDTSRVFDLGSLPNVTGIVVVPKGETESPVNPKSFRADELLSPDAGPPKITSLAFRSGPEVRETSLGRADRLGEGVVRGHITAGGRVG